MYPLPPALTAMVLTPARTLAEAARTSVPPPPMASAGKLVYPLPALPSDAEVISAPVRSVPPSRMMLSGTVLPGTWPRRESNVGEGDRAAVDVERSPPAVHRCCMRGVTRGAGDRHRAGELGGHIKLPAGAGNIPDRQRPAGHVERLLRVELADALAAGRK